MTVDAVTGRPLAPFTGTDDDRLPVDEVLDVIARDIAASPRTPWWPRFVTKVQPLLNGCWMWTGGRAANGYGTFWLDGRNLGAHRVAYAELVGPIPQGLVLDHLCRNRFCVRPAHLEVVSQRVNILRGEGLAAKAAQASTCFRGHALTPDNTSRTTGTWRVCKQCRRDRARERREASA